jgi:uncharacterized protein YkwD
MFRAMVIGSLLATGLWAQTAPAPRLAASTAEERAVVQEIAKIRKFPREYAKYLRSLGTRFEGTLWRLGDHIPIRTNEGRAAVDEAAAFLEQVTPITTPMAFSEGLHCAALSHVLDQGPSGETGHVGVNGSTMRQRILAFGKHERLIGEVINYGRETPRMTVIQLVIDDGVPDRGHRHNLFNPEFQVGGAGIGYHKDYGEMTVVDLADAYTDNK